MRDAAAALDRFAADPAVRVVVVSGHGADFSAGADLRGGGGSRDAREGAQAILQKRPPEFTGC
ncbi:hypothetical protein ACU61A_39695 [Pseudonocardia sichuanensis]